MVVLVWFTIGSYLNMAFTILPASPPPPKLKVCGMAFHSMQIKENY
jgi:hypothetical protein